MRLLVIGGTRFVGRHIVEAAHAAGHALTLFNRGQSGASPVPGVDLRLGDRRTDLSALGSDEWDAVIDCCGYLPREMRAMVERLRDRAGRYVFISSVSAYASFAQPNTESSPLGTLTDPSTEVIDADSYGPLKAACEAVVREGFGERTLLIRPGLVVGPHDPTGRFSYWPARVALAPDGEAVLVPGAAERPLQWIDARDLARFVLTAIEQRSGGTFNLVTPPGAHDWGQLLAGCAQAAGCQPRWVWADEAWLSAQGVKPWRDLPLWLPPDAEHAAFMATCNDAATAAGLRTRPLAETVADTLAWWRQLPAAQQAFTQAGLSPQREAELLTRMTTR